MDLYRFRLPGFERTYTREARNKAILVVLHREKKPRHVLDEDVREVTELCRAAGIKIKGVVEAHLPKPSPSHFVRKGKLQQIYSACQSEGGNLAVFSVDLTPSQMGNVEKEIGNPVIDRTGLILEIFGRRAKSKEGKLQVELAQLNYALPRIGGLGTVMSRLGGGVGTRGPGEQELERDKRKIRRRIQQVKSELNRVMKHRDLLRSGRKKKQFKTVALVGYTNAGKSTLLNALTGADAMVADQMFATLDTKTRVVSMNGHAKTLFVDTVGFLSNLPHSLIESFHATLEEVVQADILIHVLDASSPEAGNLKRAVEKVLADLGAEEKPLLLALNKVDKLDDNHLKELKRKWPDGMVVSAKEGKGLKQMLTKVEQLQRAVVAE